MTSLPLLNPLLFSNNNNHNSNGNKKSVKFSNVDEIKRDLSVEQLEDVNMSEWSNSRCTQTEEFINENYKDCSREELLQQLINLKGEQEASQERLHQLVDENGDYVKKYDTVNRIKEELFIKHDQVMSQYTLLKSDYATLQNTLLQTRQQVQQSNNKASELEKLSTRALKRIKDLDGENKFLSMQIDWLRSKLVNADDDLDDTSSFSSSATSITTSLNNEINQKRRKKGKKRLVSEDSGWETEI